MEEVLEYELLDIEWELKYDFDLAPSVTLIKDDSDDQYPEQDDQAKIVCDDDGIPKGSSYEDEKKRKELIYSFIKKWKKAISGHADYEVSIRRSWNCKINRRRKI